MKIKRIEVYQQDLPYAGGVYHLSGAPSVPGLGVTPSMAVLGEPLRFMIEGHSRGLI